MSSLLTIAVKNVNRFLIAAVIIFVCFVFFYGVMNRAGFSGRALYHGLALGGSFLMTLESPRGMDFPWLVRTLAWIVCFTGWLMIPLLASALVSVSLKTIDKENYYIAKFTVIARKMEVPDDKIKEFVREAMRLKDNLLG